MKLGLISSAWTQAGLGWQEAIRQTKGLLFDTIDIFAYNRPVAKMSGFSQGVIMRKCYSYARFSTTEQSKGTTLVRQDSGADAYCKRHGLVLDVSLTDKGVSAYRGKNAKDGALGAFLKAIENGQVSAGSTLIIESLDRLSRLPARAAFSILNKILDGGITVITLEPEMVYTPEGTNDLAALLPALVYMERAHNESKTKGMRVSAAIEAKRRNLKSRILTASCPSWLEAKEDRTGFRIIPRKAAIVRRVFDLAISGLGAPSIAAAFNQEGIPSLSTRKGAGHWEHSTVQKILRGRAVLGEYQPHSGQGGKNRKPVGRPVENYYPAIVSEEAWYKAQGVISARKRVAGGRRGKNTANLFSGLVVDAADGLKMRYLDKSSKRSPGKAYLVSMGAVQGRKGSSYAAFPYSIFEFVTLACLAELAPLDLREERPDTQSRRQEVEALIEDAKRRISYLKPKIETDPDFQSIADAVANLEKSKRAAEEQLKRLGLEDAEDSAGVLRDLQEMVIPGHALAPEDRERLQVKIRELVSEIRVLVSREHKFKRSAFVTLHFRQGAFWQFRIDVSAAGVDVQRFSAAAS